MPTNDKVTALLACWEEQGRTASPEEVCQDCPELLDEVRARIEALRWVGDLLRTAPSAAGETAGSAGLLSSRGDGGCRAGARIGSYTLVEPIGRGGFGEVWKARGPGGFPVALKLVPRSGAEVRSLKLLQELRHPNLLSVFGAWGREGLIAIAMELADRTLLDRFREAAAGGLPGIPRDELLEYMRQAALAIDYLNTPRSRPGGKVAAGVAHRDIKPQNLLLVGGGVKVGDLGLVRPVQGLATSHTGTLTPLYAPPEFFKGRTTARSDQYSLAVTYCVLRGGRPPLTGEAAQVMAGHLHGLLDLTMLPEEERYAVARALAKKPEQRWPTCRAFVDALSQSATGVSPAAWQSKASVVGDSCVEAGHDTPKGRGTARRHERLPTRTDLKRRPGKRVLLAIVAIAGLATAVVTTATLVNRLVDGNAAITTSGGPHPQSGENSRQVSLQTESRDRAEAPRATKMLKQGDTFYANTIVDVTTSLTVPKNTALIMNNSSGKMRQEFLCRFTVDKRDDDTWVVTQEIESLKAETGRAEPIFDARGSDARRGDYYQRTLRELRGARLSVTIDRKARSLKTDYDREALFRKVVDGVFAADSRMAKEVLSDVKGRGFPAAKRQIEVSMDDVTSSAAMTANYLFAPLFCQPLGPEGDWEQDMTLPLGPFLGVTLSGKCRFNELKGGGPKPGVFLLGFRSTVSAAPNGVTLNHLSTRITRARLDEDSIAGNIEFDLAAGRVGNVTSTQRLAGSLVIQRAGFNPAEYPVRQERTVSISVTATPP